MCHSETRVEMFYLEIRGGIRFWTFNVHGSVHHKNIPIYVQQDATLHSLLYLENCSTCLSGTSTHHQECIQMYLQHLVFVTP
jgi:hypothetical protein